MIDIHTHVLYGLDDGPRTLSEARNLLGLLHSDDIEIVIATPHLIPEKYPEVKKENVVRRIRELEPVMPLYEGYELHANYLPSNLNEYTLAGSDYVLIEFSPFTPVSSIPLIIEQIRYKGLKPIIAHTERYTLEIKTLKNFKESGALLQYNADAIIKMGSILYKLLKLELIHFVASDIHPGRPCEMKRAYESIKKFSEEEAERLFNINPYMVIKNKNI